jgi:hypothetical protein
MLSFQLAQIPKSIFIFSSKSDAPLELTLILNDLRKLSSFNERLVLQVKKNGNKVLVLYKKDVAVEVETILKLMRSSYYTLSIPTFCGILVTLSHLPPELTKDSLAFKLSFLGEVKSISLEQNEGFYNGSALVIFNKIYCKKYLELTHLKFGSQKSKINFPGKKFNVSPKADLYIIDPPMMTQKIFKEKYLSSITTVEEEEHIKIVPPTTTPMKAWNPNDLVENTSSKLPTQINIPDTVIDHKTKVECSIATSTTPVLLSPSKEASISNTASTKRLRNYSPSLDTSPGLNVKKKNNIISLDLET